MTQRTVRIYRVVVIDSHGVETNPPKTFWTKMFATAGAAGAAFTHTDMSGVDLEGRFFDRLKGDPHYIYIGRDRDRVDWPDQKTKKNPTPSPLAANANVTAVLEPCRLMPIPGTPHVAVVRSSAGALAGAVQQWLTAAYETVKSGYLIELRPATRDDQLARLKSAVGVAKIAVSLEGAVSGKGAGKISKAASELQDAVGFPVRTEIVMSMGNNKDATAYAALKKLTQRVLKSGQATKATATLVESDTNGDLQRDVVDMFADKLAFSFDVPSTVVSEAEYVRVLEAGITAFKAI